MSNHRTPAPDWQVRIGANPIGWTNDDFHDLGDATSLESCLAEIRRAGFAGSELGRKFPRTPGALAAALGAHGLALVSGWHSTAVLERELGAELAALDRHLDLLGALGADVAIVAECSQRIYDDGSQPLSWTRNGDALGPASWERLARGLEALAVHAATRGFRLAYHPHLGTVVQNEAEIDALCGRTTQLGLLVDTGHFACAGADPLTLLQRHAHRVTHVHLKNVRPEIVAAARAGQWSFERAVRAGVFTVPGDGGLNFAPILAALRHAGYRGWLVVEAEQDPALAPAFEYASQARAHLRDVAGI